MSSIFEAFRANEQIIRRIFARHFRNTADIEDLTQETFIRCFAAEIKTEIHNPKSFLLRSAKFLALSERKKKRRTTTDYMEDSGGSEVFVDDREVSGEVRLDSRRKLAALAKAIASLPVTYRRAFLMRKMEGLKLAQIATRMNISVRTAQKRVARALETCDAYLREQGYDPMEFGRGSTLTGQLRKSECASIPSTPSSIAKMGDEQND
ncbi:MAG: RNA polymerase sigma factor [Sphingomonadales bacterium]|nr:RNA polymerase sigma factor [Sphingomonadales bacterium]